MASKPAAAPLEVSAEKEPSSPLPVPSSMDDKKQPPPPLAVAMAAAMVILNVKVPPPSPPPASMDKKEKPPAVVLVCLLWALANAISFVGNAVVTLIINHNPCTRSTWWFRCAKVTRAAAVEASAMWRGQLWCAAPQAVAAAMALGLVVAGRGRRWSRWAVAWALVALAATAAGHYMEGRVDRIFLAAAPGDAYLTADAVANCVFVMLDLLGFFCLVIQIGDGGEE